jgi:probable phosphoglycerate mutase
LAERKNQLYTWRFPGGESYEDADLRAGVALDKIADSGAAHPVVVTHEMIGRMLLRHLLGLAPEEALRLSMVQGSIYVVDPANPSIAAI